MMSSQQQYKNHLKMCDSDWIYIKTRNLEKEKAK